MIIPMILHDPNLETVQTRYFQSENPLKFEKSS